MEKDKWFEKFSVEVEKEMLNFAAAFKINGRILTGIRSFFEGSSHVNREEFKTYTRPILDNYKFIQALEWIPRVPAAQRKIFEENTRNKGFPDFVITERTLPGKLKKAEPRPEYFPVLYLEPMKGNEKALGYDLGSNSTRSETLKLSRDSGQPVATEKVNLVQEEQHDVGILIFVPLYEEGVIPKTVTERREKLQGFILGVYRTKKMVQNILAPMTEAGVNLVIFQGKEISEKNKLFGNRTSNPPLEIIKHYDFFGRIWTFVWQGNDKFFRGFNRNHAVLWFTGIFLSTIFIAIIFNLVLIRRDSEKKLGAILGSAGEGIYGLDIDGMTTFVNSSAEQMLGYSLKEMSKKPQHDLIHHSKPDGTPYHKQECLIYAALHDGKRHRSNEDVFWKKDGTSFPVEFLSTPIIEEGQIVGAVVTFKDITERKKVEKELKKHREHLEELVEERTDELTRANEQLRELDHLKSMFMASMSHELRTPLNSIIGFNCILLDEMAGKINPKQKDYLSRAYQSGKHLLGLINDIMDISKIESGTLEALPELFDLEEVITEAVNSVDAQKMKSTGVELKVAVPSNLEIYNDRRRILQCIINYLSNAIKFTRSGFVSISAKEVGDKVEIMVEDTGIGIEETDLPRLFQQFERLDYHLKIPVSGTGLGLYLTKKLATEVIGGSVAVESQPGVGSKFYLRFQKKLPPH